MKNVLPAIIVVCVLAIVYWNWWKHKQNKAKVKKVNANSSPKLEFLSIKDKDNTGNVISPFPNQNPVANEPIKPVVPLIAPDRGSVPLKDVPSEPVVPNANLAAKNKKRR